MHTSSKITVIQVKYDGSIRTIMFNIATSFILPDMNTMMWERMNIGGRNSYKTN